MQQDKYNDIGRIHLLLTPLNGMAMENKKKLEIVEESLKDSRWDYVAPKGLHEFVNHYKSFQSQLQLVQEAIKNYLRKNWSDFLNEDIEVKPNGLENKKIDIGNEDEKIEEQLLKDCEYSLNTHIMMPAFKAATDMLQKDTEKGKKLLFIFIRNLRATLQNRSESYTKKKPKWNNFIEKYLLEVQERILNNYTKKEIAV